MTSGCRTPRFRVRIPNLGHRCCSRRNCSGLGDRFWARRRTTWFGVKTALRRAIPAKTGSRPPLSFKQTSASGSASRNFLVRRHACQSRSAPLPRPPTGNRVPPMCQTLPGLPRHRTSPVTRDVRREPFDRSPRMQRGLPAPRPHQRPGRFCRARSFRTLASRPALALGGKTSPPDYAHLRRPPDRVIRAYTGLSAEKTP